MLLTEWLDLRNQAYDVLPCLLRAPPLVTNFVWTSAAFTELMMALCMSVWLVFAPRRLLVEERQ